MIRHLIKLIWNKRKAHSLLIVEIWASFMVLFGLCTLIIYNLRNYAEPLGFEYKNRWAINLSNNQDTTDVAEKVGMVLRRVKACPEVESGTQLSAELFPFSSSNNGTGVTYRKRETVVNFVSTDENYAQTMSINLIAGKWYSRADRVGKYIPVVINRKAQEKLFDGENPVGKILSDTRIIAGVVDTYKDKAEFMDNKPTMFELIDPANDGNTTLIIKIKPGADALFEAKLVKDIAAVVKDWNVQVVYLDAARESRINQTLIPVTIFLTICTFLLINVALGLFGVLNVSIARRRGEIGLRRALGATEGAVSRQFVGEMLVLATFALVLGLIIAGQFPLLNVFDLDPGVYWAAMAVSVLLIYLMVAICALYPSRQAATIQPAVALHEE
ncbi:MAG: FtsX-like permease family protein [Bacteroidetes bacterium]|nr:FtsX-like permease family protein [Fibrella sp.]